MKMRPEQGSIHDTRKRRVSCMIIHTRWAPKNTRNIHEVGGFFNSM